MDKKILYFDMDNVLVNFQSGVDKISQKVKDQYGDKIDEIPHLFSLMEPIDGAIDAFKTLSEKYDCYILSTAPWNNPTAASDKFDWVKKYLGEVARKKLILSHHKNLNRGDYLVDDRPTKCGADKFEGEVIEFGGAKFPDWKTVIDYLMNK